MKRGRNTRDITAPKFDPTTESTSNTLTTEKTLKQYLHIDAGQGSTVPPLEDSQNVTLEKYCGPTPESNWVLPGKLLVGAYPASENDEETFALLSSILKCKVNKFICLQQEYKMHGVTESMYVPFDFLNVFENVIHFIMFT